MDYDHDGIQDIISGSYDPGDIYLIKGLGDGKYAKVEPILDVNEVPLVHHPVELARYLEFTKEKQSEKSDDEEYVRDSDEAIQWRVASFGSWPATVDWDADGDLDMLIGTFSGQMFLRTNIGTRSQPEFSGDSDQIMAAGKPLKETGHAAPVVADWDHDGIWDLVVGSSDGSVGWYRNVGTVEAPEFDERRMLVYPKSKGKFLSQYLAAGDNGTPGVRAQVCVIDYNHDGRLDLVVGDYKDANWMRQLSDSEQAEFDEIIAIEQAAMDRITALRQQYAERYKEMSDEERKQMEAKMAEVGNELDWEAHEKKKKKYFSRDASIVSNVWLYLRKSEKDQLTQR